MLSDERKVAMPAALRQARRYAEPGCFEEDCEASLVVLAFPTEFTFQQVVEARRMLDWLVKNSEAGDRYRQAAAYLDARQAVAS
jgi:hypothetical protein